MENIALIENYLNQLDPADVLEILEHVSTEKLESMLSEDLDSHAILKMLGAPDIADPYEVRKGRLYFGNMPSTVMDFMATFVEICGYHVADHIILAAVLIKNKKINTAEKEQLLSDTVARVQYLDDFVHRLYLIVRLVRTKAVYMELTEADACLLQLLGGFIECIIKVLTAMDESMPDWWAVGKTRLDIAPVISSYRDIVMRSIRMDLYPFDQNSLLSNPLFAGGSESMDEMANSAAGVHKVRAAHEALMSIALPPALVDAVPGIEEMVDRQPAATSKKVNKELLERFRQMNDKKIYWLSHYYRDLDN